MKPLALALLVLVAGCHSSTPPAEQFDLSGVTPTDLSATVPEDGGVPEDAGDVDDAAGYACDPAVGLDGGDPEGLWTVHGGCATGEAFYEVAASCPAMTFETVDVRAPSGSTPTGFLNLYDTSYDRTLNLRLTGIADVPSSCVQGSCITWAATTKAQYTWLDSVSCSTQSGGCKCTFDGTYSSGAESGTWARSDNGFVLTSSAGTIESYEAAADTSTLRMRGDDTSTRGSRGVTLVLGR